MKFKVNILFCKAVNAFNRCGFFVLSKCVFVEILSVYALLS